MHFTGRIDGDELNAIISLHYFHVHILMISNYIAVPPKLIYCKCYEN